MQLPIAHNPARWFNKESLIRQTVICQISQSHAGTGALIRLHFGCRSLTHPTASCLPSVRFHVCTLIRPASVPSFVSSASGNLRLSLPHYPIYYNSASLFHHVAFIQLGTRSNPSKLGWQPVLLQRERLGLEKHLSGLEGGHARPPPAPWTQAQNRHRKTQSRTSTSA